MTHVLLAHHVATTDIARAVPLLRAAAFAALALTGATTSVHAQGPSGTIVVTNKSAATASIIDLASGRILASLPTGAGPHEIALSRDGRTAVVTNYGGPGGGNSLTVIEVPGRLVLRTIDLGDYRRPHGIAFLPGDSLVAVTSETSQNVVIVHVGNGAIRRVIPTQHAGSHMLAFGAAGSPIFTGDIGSNTVSMLDARTGAYVRSYSVPAQPEAIGMPLDGREVWVGSNAEGFVSVVDITTGAVTRAAEGFGWPYRILFTPDGATVLIPDLRREELRFIDRATRREVARISFTGGGPQGITLTPDGRFAFLSLSAQNQVVIIDVAARAVIRTIQAGPAPDGVVYSSRSGPADTTRTSAIQLRRER